MKHNTACQTISRSCFTALALLLCLFGHAQLNADFTMSRTGGCSPLNISFTNASAGTTAQTVYSWSFGNGNSSALQNPSAIFLEEKTYNITLTISQGGATSTKTKTITVYKKPVVDFTAAAPKICLPAPAVFNSTATASDGTISNYQWDFGDGFTQQGFGTQIAHNYNVALTPAVSLTVTNSFGCQASATKTPVEVLPKLEPLFTVNKTTLCSLAETVTFTNNSTGPGPLTYAWNFGDGTTSTLPNPTHRYTAKGVYAVSLTVSNAVGCTATSLLQSINAAFFQTAFTASPLCRTVAFSGSAFMFPSASRWEFGNGQISNSYSNVSHTYATAGNYTVLLINTYGTCVDTATKTVAVQNLTVFSSAIAAPAAACRNHNVVLTSSSTQTPSVSNWNFGDGFSLNAFGNSVNHIYANPGTYTITLTNTFGTCTETVTKTIVVNDLPTTTGFVVDYGGVCGAPVTVTFTDTTAGAVSWRWALDFAGNTPFSTAATAPLFFANNGGRTVYLTVTNAAGCTKTVAKSVVVNQPSASIYILQSSSPRGIYDCDSLTLKLGVNSNQTIQSYSWDLGNGTTSTLASPIVRYTQVGIYPVVLTYVTESGCTRTANFWPAVYADPAANFNYYADCNASLQVNFIDTSPFSDGWAWTFGDGGTGGGNFPTHGYADTGFYSVRFINRVGHCSDTVVKVIHLTTLPSRVTITRADNTCDGTRATITFDQRSVRASGGTWNFGDGTIIPYDSSNHFVQHTYAATGRYTVTITSSYNGCVCTSTQIVKVLLKQAPVLSGTPTQLCTNGSVAVQITNLQTNPFSASFSSYDQYAIERYVYGNGANFTGFISNTSFLNTTYTATLQNFTPGNQPIRAIITEYYTGCRDTTTYLDLVVNGPIAGFTVANNNGCFKTPLVFTDTSRSVTTTPLTTWRWEFGDGQQQTNSTAASVSHLYASPGTYTVRLTVTDATNCSKTATSIVTTKGPKASFTTSGLFVPNVPLNTAVTFTNTYFGNSSNTTYRWDYGNGANSTGFNGSHTYTVAGTYTVILIATDATVPCADTARQTIVVRDFNTSFAFTTTFIGPTSCPPVLVRINNLSVGYTRLLWDFGDGTGSTQAFPSHTYHTPGLYRITLYTYGFNGLSGTYRDSVFISAPSAQLSADILQGCTQQTVSLQATTQNSASYLWDFGDGSFSTSATTAPHPYTTAGIYIPRLIVKDANGCPAPAQLADSIIIDSLAVNIKGIPAIVCDSALIQFMGDVQSFSATTLGTTLQYKWDFGTGIAADTSAVRNPAFRFVTPGTYTVRLTVSSPYGCTRTTTAVVVVNQQAHGRITSGAENCEQQQMQFTGTVTPAGTAQWNWNFGNGNTSNLPTPPVQVYNPGTYAVTLILTSNGCADTVVQNLTIHPKPAITLTPRQAVLCRGGSLAIAASGGVGYLWTPAADLVGATTANPVASPVTNTTYTVQVTSAKGCVATDSVVVTVAQPITVSLPAAVDVCRGLQTRLTAGGATTYQWISNVAGLSGTVTPNPLAGPVATTTYTVVGKDQYNCFTDTASVVVTVLDKPAVSAGPDLQQSGNAPVQLSTSASADVTTYLWQPANTLSCSNCPAPLATPNVETAYVVQVKNAAGCEAKDTVLVKLNCAAKNVRIPDAFTPNNDGKNDVFYIAGSGVKVVRHLRIYDRWGQVAFERRGFAINDASSAWDGRRNGQPLATGTYVYFAEMECASGEVFMVKGTVTLIR